MQYMHLCSFIYRCVSSVLVICTPHNEKETMHYFPFQENQLDAENDCLPPAEIAAEEDTCLIKMKFLFLFILGVK